MKNENILSKVYPNLVDEWCVDLNLPLTPHVVTIGSRMKIFWKCQNGHIYQSSIRSRTTGHRCPICSNTKIVAGINDLQTLDPILVKEWDYEKNIILPTQIGVNSKKKVFWKCAQGHTWEAVIYDRHSKQTKCPYCCGKRLIEGENDFMTHHPELISEWDFVKNEIQPNQVHNKSSKKVWWICKYGHSWNAPVYSRSNGIGCPMCAKESQTSFPEQAIFHYVKKYFPNAVNRAKLGDIEADIFIPDTNTIIEYDGVYWHKNKVEKDAEKNRMLRNSNYRVIRIREHGLETLGNSENIIIGKDKNQSYKQLESAIISLLTILSVPNFDVNIKDKYNDILEQTLSGNKANSLAYLYPNLLKEWDLDKNGNIIPDYLYSKSSRKVWWICPKCGFSYRKAVRDRTCSQQGCPICSNRRDILHVGVNDVKTVYPELLKEWDYILNKDVMPENISIHSSCQIWWRCEKGHVYQKSISKRINDGGCPFCRGLKVLAGYNDFATVRDDLLFLWDYEKNSILPSEITYGSNKKVWWLCLKGHHFLNSPKRIIAGERCPYCSGRRIQSDINSLLAVNPNLAKEWDVDKNTISCDSVAPNSTKKYWWKCSHCGYSWQATCANRHSKKSGCPQCYKKSRSREK